jgi:hypothetical protein
VNTNVPVNVPTFVPVNSFSVDVPVNTNVNVFTPPLPVIFPFGGGGGGLWGGSGGRGKKRKKKYQRSFGASILGLKSNTRRVRSPFGDVLIEKKNSDIFSLTGIRL